MALSLMTALLPRLSRYAAHRDYPRLVDGLSRGLRLTGVVIAPVAAAMVVLGPYLAVVLFGHPHSARAAFGLVLVPFTGYMILLRGFYALQDTRTPAWINTVVSVIGIAGCFAAHRLLPRHQVVLGLPVAYALAYTCGLVLAGLLLRRRLGRLDGRRLAHTHARTAAAVVVAAGAASAAAHATAAAAGTGWAGALVTVTAALLVGAAGYAVALRLLNPAELRHRHRDACQPARRVSGENALPPSVPGTRLSR